MQAQMIDIHPVFGPSLPDQNWVPAPRYILRRDRVLRHLHRVPPCRVLDIGCGPGALLTELSRLGFQAYGVDRSAQARQLGQSLSTTKNPVTLQAELDPGWKGTFDLLFSFEVIEHIEDDKGALRDWRPYLSDGGGLILSTPAHRKKWSANDEWAGHCRRYEKDELIETIEQAGFEVEHIECYGFPLTSIMDPLRARAYGRQLREDKAAQKPTMAHTEESGSNRTMETRIWNMYSRGVGQMAMRLFCQLQRPFLNTELGNGFLVLAKAV